MAGNTSTPGASVAARTLALLYAFDERHRALSLSDLARRSRLPLATTHRLAGELVAGGALERRSDGRFTIGRRLWDVGVLAPLQTGLQSVASPFLSDIHATTRATVHLAVRDGTHALYVDRRSGHGSVPVVSGIGSRLPLHATGVGKVLLAHAPPAVQDEVLGAGLAHLTPYTVVQPGRLRQQLARVRGDGYATTVEEMTLGACSVAAPVRVGGSSEQPGRVVAAVGVVVPDLKRDRPRLVSALQVAAQGIGRSLQD